MSLWFLMSSWASPNNNKIFRVRFPHLKHFIQSIVFLVVQNIVKGSLWSWHWKYWWSMIGHQRSLFYQTKWSPSCATPWPSCSCGWHRAGETSLTRVSRPDKDHRGLGLKQSSSCRCGFPKGFWQHSQFWRGLTENGWKSTTPFVHSNSFFQLVVKSVLTIANVW